ncbi:Glutamyl/glutaminyl-tRNA synthetase [Bartonella apihabitans]|uniref:tRNA glutamyl-Q(34) synthetase GluQRS n=1 Tax=Bartonella apihabitans TaxID=2750929 RepID=UPI0039972C58
MVNIKPVRLRFAPSPNGYLHLGHAYSALVNKHIARILKGELVLRMENIDRTRCKTHYENAIVEDLSWLGVDFRKPFRRQSEHFSDYQKALDELEKLGLVYPAFLTRGEVKEIIAEAERKGKNWPRDPDGTPLYPTDERSLSKSKAREMIAEGVPYSWRLNMDLALRFSGKDLFWHEFHGNQTKKIIAHPELWGDVIIARKDMPTSYHLSVVVDDALQHITHVVRGNDLFQATSVHRLLQTILGYEPPLYYHHPLVLGHDGHKLSKSNKDTSLRSLREKGLTANDIFALLPKI